MPDEARQPLKVALYARVSTEEQREGQTIDSQVAELERFARDRAWLIAGVYKDAGWSGGLLARPDLDRLRDAAAKRLFDAVLINDVDRLARDVSHLGVIKRDLERHGARVIFRKLPTENSPTHNLMVNILGSFAEFERELISDRTRRGRRYKVETRQLFLGCIPAYGYRYLPKDRSAGKEGSLQIVPKEAAVVRQMYSWVAEEGLSARRVMLRLNKMGLRPRKGAGLWAKSSVLRILRSEMYAGVWHYNKYEGCEPKKPIEKGVYRRAKSSTQLRKRRDWIPVRLPAELRLIERDQWEQAQSQITRNIAFSPRNSRHRYLLTGLVRCGGCSGPMVGDPCHGVFYYRCHRRCKKLPTIKDDTLSESVWQAIQDALHNPNLILEQVSQIQQEQASKREATPLEAKRVEVSLKQLEFEESRLLEAYRKAIISPAQLGVELEGLAGRRTAVEASKAALEHQAPEANPEAVRVSVEEFCRTFASRTDTFPYEQRQQFLRSMVRTIVYEGERVRVKCVIPNHPIGTRDGGEPAAIGPRLRASGEALETAFERGRIATTEPYLPGHNLGRENTAPPYEPSTAHEEIAFQIHRSISSPKRVGVRGPAGKFLSRLVVLASFIQLLKVRREALRRRLR